MVPYLLDSVGDKYIEATCIVGNIPNDDLAVGQEYFKNTNLVVLKFLAEDGTCFY